MPEDTLDIEKLKADALKILSPIKTFDETTKAPPKFLFTAKRSNAGRTLPPYYLVYFLLELLEFKNLGKFEKLAWSFPVDYNGRAFLIEYRKMGLGIFIEDEIADEAPAKIIAQKITGAVKKINPFYNYIAQKAVEDSQLNVTNKNGELFNRFEYLRTLYKRERSLYEKKKGQTKIKKGESKFGSWTTYSPLGMPHLRKANWLAISCIEAFFSWTEHLFIHLAIIAQNLQDGKEIADLINAEWKVKFSKAIPLADKTTKKFYDELLIVRQQLRNFVAHGAFGKNGNAFTFHSKAGAVPVLLSHEKDKNRFSLVGTLNFDEVSVLQLMDEFIKFLWKGRLRPAMHYTQEAELPTIVTFARDGTYQNAMSSFADMEAFVDELSMQLDNAANMDW